MTLSVVSVIPAGRIAGLDVLRGFAVLGILVMNIQMFSMPEAAYLNPTAWGDLTGINLVTWFVSHLLTDTKFISIFSMLFGAGVCLFTDRTEARGGRAARLHYRRMFWLLVFGLIHAYLLWVGDILVPYALCGCLVFLLWKARPRTQALAGVGVSSLGYIPKACGMYRQRELARVNRELSDQESHSGGCHSRRGGHCRHYCSLLTDKCL